MGVVQRQFLPHADHELQRDVGHERVLAEPAVPGEAARLRFDHVVKTTPEQRIVAGEKSTITTVDGTYDVSWDTHELTYDDPSVYNCADAGPPPSGGSSFAMVLRAATP